MGTYLAIFLIELTTAYIAWVILKKILRTDKVYRIAVVALVVSLAVGYAVSYRIAGYNITLGYLTTINDQRVEETGKSITLQEENYYKEELFQKREFQEALVTSTMKLSLFSFLFVVGVLLYLVPQRRKIMFGLLLLGWMSVTYGLVEFFSPGLAYILVVVEVVLFIKVTGLWDWIKHRR